MNMRGFVTKLLRTICNNNERGKEMKRFYEDPCGTSKAKMAMGKTESHRWSLGINSCSRMINRMNRQNGWNQLHGI